MAADSELDLWRDAWTADAPPTLPDGIAVAARRQERRLRVRYLLNLAGAAFLAALPVWILRINFNAEALAWAIVVWLGTLAAVVFQIWNWRVLWRTSARPVTGYASAYLDRCQATFRAVRFGYAFLAIQVAISGCWFSWDFVRGEITAARFAVALLLLGAVTALIWLCLRASRRRALLEYEEAKAFLAPPD
ncbi:MAG: hypothetical protein C5B56_05665 [Proteobacteria bacterium]|nr:MAG: hypothetical protein C5B56_05665 [Pseudomonadota bacterium]